MASTQTTIDAGLLTRLCAGGHENATTVAPDGSQDPLDLPFPVAVSLVAVLLCLSGLFSGLTLGLMSLDRLNLQVIEKGGDAKERKWAATIRPLRDQGNLLLCTLLLGNTLVNSLISILLDSVTQGMVAVLVATFVILIFGEIIPQAICVRFGLAIGALFKPVVYIFIICFYPVTYPISKLLDLLLGRDIGQVYTKQELKHLISIHCNDVDANPVCGLTNDDHKLLRGAFEYKERSVRDVMTALDHVFMLELSTRLCPKTLLEIYRMGFTRIPVYQRTRSMIVGVLYTKDLILIDPDDDVELASIIGFREAAGEELPTQSMVIDEGTKLDEVLKIFKQTCSHMLFATNHSRFCVTGIITLEDVLEEMICDEIVDESDTVVDTNHPEKPHPLQRRGHDLSRFLQNMHREASEDAHLSQEELSAVVAYLVATTNEFKCFKECDIALAGLIRNHSEVVDIRFECGSASPAGSGSGRVASSPTASMDNLDDAGTGLGGLAGLNAIPRALYAQGKPTDTFTLILSGKVTIESGMEKFILELGPWSKLCEKALSTDKYVPDFCAKVVKSTQPCRLLQIQRSAYLAAKHAAAYELRVGKMSLKKSVKKLLEEGKQTKLIPGHDGEEPAGTHAHTQDGDGDDDDDPGEVGEDVALLGSGARRSEQAQRKSDVVIELM